MEYKHIDNISIYNYNVQQRSASDQFRSDQISTIQYNIQQTHSLRKFCKIEIVNKTLFNPEFSRHTNRRYKYSCKWRCGNELSKDELSNYLYIHLCY